MNHTFRITRAARRGRRFHGLSVGQRLHRAAGISGLAASVLAGASLLLGCPTHSRATDIYTASYGGTNDTGGTGPISSGTFTLSSFTVTAIYGSGSSETLFVTDGTANGQIYGTAPTGVAVGKQYSATVTDSLYHGEEEFTKATFTALNTTAAVTIPTATASQVAATINGTANPFTTNPSDSLYASEGKFLLSPVTFTLTFAANSTGGSVAAGASTTLTDSAGDAVSVYKSAIGFSYAAGKSYTVTGDEQPYPPGGAGTTVESEIVNISAFTLNTPPPTALYRQTPFGSWVPSGGTDWSSAAAGPGNTGWLNDGTITAFFQIAPTAAVTINGGNINATGLEFDVSGYNIASDGVAGDTLTLQNVGLVTVPTAGNTATISAPVAGTIGLLKNGAGTLVLSGANTYTGGTNITGGVLSIGADGNLGGSSSGISLGGGTLQTTASITTARTLDGSGSLAPATGTTFTVSGAVGSATAGAITISDVGTVALTAPTGTTKSLGGLGFTAAATLNVTGAPLALTGTLSESLATGTATVNGSLALGTVSHTVSITTAGTELLLTGSLTGTGALSKTSGAGTLGLTGDNSGYSGTISVGGTTATGGVVSVGSATALGTGTLNLDTGTVSNDTGAALTTGVAVSIGAQATGAGAVLAGSPVTLTGNVSIYAPSGSTTQQSLVVNNVTTISGVFNKFSTATGVTSYEANSTGLTFSGTGTLNLTGANTFTSPLTVSGVTVNAGSASGKALGTNTALSVVTGGTLTLTTASQVLTTAPISLNAGSLGFANGANQGSGATNGGGTVSGTSAVGLGALTLTGSSTLNFSGTAATAVFTSFDPTNMGAGTYTLNVTGSNFGTATNSADGTNNRLIFNQNVGAAGFLGDITFNGVADATETALDSGFYEITPNLTAVPEPTTVLGGVLLTLAGAWSQRRRLRALVAI